MVVPYAYLGFKATNKSKRKFAMYDGFFKTNLKRKVFQMDSIDFDFLCISVCIIKILWLGFARFDRCNLSFWHMSIKIYHNIKSTIPTF